MPDFEFPYDFTESDFEYWDDKTTNLLNASHKDMIVQWTDEHTDEGLITLTHNDLIRLVRQVAEAYTGS